MFYVVQPYHRQLSFSIRKTHQPSPPIQTTNLARLTHAPPLSFSYLNVPTMAAIRTSTAVASSFPAYARTAGRAVHIKISPRPLNLAEGRQILRKLEEYGEVIMYKHLKVSLPKALVAPVMAVSRVLALHWFPLVFLRVCVVNVLNYFTFSRLQTSYSTRS